MIETAHTLLPQRIAHLSVRYSHPHQFFFFNNTLLRVSFGQNAIGPSVVIILSFSTSLVVSLTFCGGGALSQEERRPS
jgi:hypothetical protein